MKRINLYIIVFMFFRFFIVIVKSSVEHSKQRNIVAWTYHVGFSFVLSKLDGPIALWTEHGVRKVHFFPQVFDDIENQSAVFFFTGVGQRDGLPRWILKKDVSFHATINGERFTFTPTWYVAIGKLIPRNPCATWGKMTSVRLIPRVGNHDPESIKCALFLPRAKKLPHVMAEANRQNKHLPQVPPVAKVSWTSFICEKNGCARIELATRIDHRW